MPPPDTRRISGPEQSHDYKVYVRGKEQHATSKAREDGRSDEEHRAVFMKTGILSQAKGSAYLEQGQTKVLCAVYGPRELDKKSDFAMKGLLSCYLRRAPFATRTRTNPGQRGSVAESEDREISLALQQALEATIALHLYPKSQIDVHVLVLEDDGSLLAASLTCSGMALVDASIHMLDVLIGASLKRCCKDRFVIDPAHDEERLGHDPSADNTSLVTVGFLPNMEQTVQLLQIGMSSPEALLLDVQCLTKKCLDLFVSVEQCLKTSLTDKLMAD